MRKLNEEGIEILKKLAPEIQNKSQIEYRSIERYLNHRLDTSRNE